MAAVKDAQLAARQPVGVQVVGLRELRRDLKQLPGKANHELNRELKLTLIPVAARARALTPRRSGRLAASLRPFVVGTRAGVRSRLPYANVIHWGGTVGRGRIPGASEQHRAGHGSARIEKSLFIQRAIDEMDTKVVDDVGDALERAAKKLGWH